jgi:ABC-type lipoprotein release transport system permease subunit
VTHPRPGITARLRGVPVTFTVVPALQFAVALLASWLPAQRAGSVEPTQALRVD